MLLRILSCIAFLLASTASLSAGSQEWISLRTSHFEMYTTNSADQARATLAVLEEVRSFFEQTTTLIRPTAKPVRIIAFRSREEYAPFRLQSTSFAHYLHSRRGDYIVLQDISPEHRRAAIHEYTHYVFRTAGFELPIWLCEGTADFYSSLESQGAHSVLGRTLPSRFRTLQEAQLLSLPTLFDVDRSSPFYNDGSKVLLFYSQSWALVHMLAFHRNYRELFPVYLRTVSSGIKSAEAFQQVYAKSVAEVEEDLQAYVREISANQMTVDLQPAHHEEPSVESLSEFEGALAMADLLAAHRTTAREAKSRLDDLTEREPGNPKAEELLSYLAAQEHDSRAAQ